MKELTSKKTGKVMRVSNEVWDKIVAAGNAYKYRVREVRTLVTTPPKILKPEEKSVVKKPTKKD
jgi:hypothetical protein